MKKLFVVAGEASGDLHASNLLKALKNIQPDLVVKGFGGDEMQKAGAEIILHYREMDFMGFIEVIKNLGTIKKNLKLCKDSIRAFQPDVLVLIDYPGFNLRIAKFAKELGIKVVYYISPQIWAWKEGRVELIKKVVDKMLVILPFEKAFYAKHNYDVDFVGHPLLDALNEKKDILPESQTFKTEHQLSEKPIIALLPGSRKQEIATKLPVMLAAVEPYKNRFQIVVAAAPSQQLEVYQHWIKDTEVKLIQGNTYAILNLAHSALVTSGTATLETALFKVPQVVCYKGSNVSYQIAKRLVKVKYISLVNLIMDAPVVKELIQDDFTVGKVQHELNLILEGKNRADMMREYEVLAQKLGSGGASSRAAQIIAELLV